MSNKIDKIINNLYIGNYDAALDQNIIESYNIHTIINCTKKSNRTNLNVEYLQIPIDDPPYDNDINYVNTNFLFIVDFITNKINSGKNVLVHCVMGSQRSAAIVAIYLMIRYKSNHSHAIQYIKSRRPICFFGKINYMESLIYIQNLMTINKNIQN